MALILTYVYWFNGASPFIAKWMMLFEFLVFAANVLILFALTKMFKIADSIFGKAMFFVGVGGLASVIYQFMNLLHFPGIIISIIALLWLVGYFFILVKLYNISVGKSIGLGISTSIITGIIGVILFFVFAFAGLIKFSQIINTNNQSADNANNPVVNNNNNQESLYTASPQTNPDINAGQEPVNPPPAVNNNQNNQDETNLLPIISVQDYSGAISHLPSDFPHIQKNLIYSIENDSEYSAYTIAFTSTDNFQNILSLYKNYFQNNGWTVDVTPEGKNSITLMAEIPNANPQKKIRLIFDTVYSEKTGIVLTVWY